MNTATARKSSAGIILLLAVVLLPSLAYVALLACGGHVNLSLIPGHFGRRAEGMGYEFGLYHSEDDKAYEETQAGFANWILARGFTPTPSPGGMTEWAGVHSSGQKQQWYQMPVGANRLMLCVTTDHENDRDITAELSDDGYYTSTELADMHRREIALWNDMFAWFETNSKANVFLERPDMKDWYAKGRDGINKTYSKQY